MQYASRLGKWTPWVAALVLLFGARYAAAADWPQFQGPNRDGTSPETGLARTWPETGPKELWRATLGAGFAGPAVRDGEVYLLDREAEARDILRCFSLETGVESWRHAYDAPGAVSHDGSRTTPTVTERHVFTVGMLGHFYCFDRQTHEPVWHKNLLEEFGQAPVPRWGVAQSPVLYGDLVIVAPQAPEAQVAAFKQATGELVWASQPYARVSYSPPVLVNLCGVDQFVMLTGQRDGKAGPNTIVGLNATDGAALWTYEGWGCQIPIPYATAIPGDRLFITGGYEAGSLMLKLAREGDAFKVEELFASRDYGSQIHQPLIYRDHLYFNNNENSRTGGMTCLDFDGTLRWKTADDAALPEFERGNLILADGMIISLDGRTGLLHLIEPSPEGYQELARAPIFDGTTMWSPMALSNGRLLLRDQGMLKCLELVNP